MFYSLTHVKVIHVQSVRHAPERERDGKDAVARIRVELCPNASRRNYLSVNGMYVEPTWTVLRCLAGTGNLRQKNAHLSALQDGDANDGWTNHVVEPDCKVVGQVY